MIKLILLLLLIAILMGARYLYNSESDLFTSFSTQKANNDILKRLNGNISNELLSLPIISIIIDELKNKNIIGKLSQRELYNFSNNLLLISKGGYNRELLKFAVITDKIFYNFNSISNFEIKDKIIIPLFLNKYENVNELINNLNEFYDEAIKLQKYLQGISLQSTIAPNYENVLPYLCTLKLEGIQTITGYYYSNSEKFCEVDPTHTIAGVYHNNLDKLSQEYLKFKNSGVNMPFEWYVELKDEDLVASNKNVII